MEFKDENIQEGYYDNDNELMDTEFLEEENSFNCDAKTPEYAIANVSCQYDGSPGINIYFATKSALIYLRCTYFIPKVCALIHLLPKRKTLI